jgi:hypothetical protein
MLEPARNPPVPRHKGSISEHMILATAEVHVFRPPRKESHCHRNEPYALDGAGPRQGLASANTLLANCLVRNTPYRGQR